MDTEDIKRLLAPFLSETGLSAKQMEQVTAHLGLLLKWNAKMNLTAVRAPEEIVTRHFGESFFAARVLLNQPTDSLIDLGSGAGFPGLPMTIYAPEINVTLIESHNKKATFLKEVVRALELKTVEVFSGRGEDYNGHAALVTLRAVEKFEKAASVAGGLVGAGGRLGLLTGAGQENALPPGFEWEVGKPIPGSRQRVVVSGRRR